MIRKYAYVLLDASLSMRGQEERVNRSITSYVRELRATTPDIKVEIAQFDTGRPYEVLFSGPSESFVELSGYRTEGGTPLYDAVARMISSAERDYNPGDRVALLIDTDGDENSSREFDREKIKRLVSAKKELGWDITFVGGTLDMGHSRHLTQTYGGDWGTKMLNMTHATRDTAYRSMADMNSTYFKTGNVESTARAQAAVDAEA